MLASWPLSLGVRVEVGKVALWSVSLQVPMGPSQPTTETERRVLRWFLLVLAVISVAYLTVTWWSKSRDCQTQCIAKGLGDGALRFNGGGRFNLGTYCECARSPNRSGDSRAQ